MKKIKLVKSGDKLIGAMRCNPETYNKLKKLADKNKVSVVVIVKTILENVIDEVEIV